MPQLIPTTTVQNLRTRLQEGPTDFAFRTKSGNLRIARGTVNLDYIPQEFHPKGGEASPKVVAFFDLEKGAWRSFQTTSLVFS